METNKYIKEIMDKYDFDNIQEMLYELLPRGYNIPTAFADISEVPIYPDKSQVTLFGYIDSFESQQMKSRKALSKIKAKLYKNGYSVTLNWIIPKQKARGMIFSLEKETENGSLVQVTGKINSYTFDNGNVFKFLDNPKIVRVKEGNNQENSSNNGFNVVPEPMYRLKDKVKVLQIKSAYKAICEGWDNIYKDNFLPKELEDKLGLQPLVKSIKYLHGLNSIPMDRFHSFLAYEGFRKRLMAEKVWTIMKNGYSNKQLGGNSDFNINDKDISNIKLAISKLPFDLTGDQKKAIWGLLKHYEEKRGSKNLIFGDVGSGKTLVAIIVAFILYKRGGQVAIMTPSSILAKQHFEEAKEMFPEEFIYIIHSKTKKRDRDNLNELLRDKKPAIVIGTSSLNQLEFSNLSLVIIDEEQKFGVKDKNKLVDKFNGNPHLVLMTATPIPRTLAGAMFSDFSILKIEEKPAMQKDRITKIANLENMNINEINDIKFRMNNKEQTLVIVPSIVSNDLISVNSAMVKYKKIFPEFSIDTINGKMKPDMIEKVTQSFMNGEISILIATTMVDAGFSNKMLSHVFIENSERFGIAQMHQIRGRVGRGSLQGYCYISIATSLNSLKETTKKRLDSLVMSENGFELSMADISLRGSGDLLGNQQSGSEINLMEWIEEAKIIENYLKNK